MATRPLPAKKLLRCSRGRHRSDCKGDKDPRHPARVRQRCTSRGHVYGCKGPTDSRHVRPSRSESAKRREAAKRARRAAPMDEATLEHLREQDSASKAAARMRRYRARKRAKENSDPVTLSGDGACLVDSVGSVTLPTPISRSAGKSRNALSANRAIPPERLPKALQPFAGIDCPCPCHGWPTESVINAVEDRPIPAPKHPEPPERRRLINEARAEIAAGTPYDPDRRWPMPGYIVRIVERRNRGEAESVAVVHRPAPEPGRVPFGHRADCTDWALDVRLEDDGWRDEDGWLDEGDLLPSVGHTAFTRPACGGLTTIQAKAMIPDRAAFRRGLNLPVAEAAT